MEVTVDATRRYMEGFVAFLDALENEPPPQVAEPLPTHADRLSLLAARRYDAARALIGYTTETTTRFYTGISNLPSGGVDPRAIELADLWRRQAHYVMACNRCYDALLLACMTYTQNNGFVSNFVARFTGNGRAHQSAEIDQRNRYNKALAEFNDADARVAEHMRELQMCAEALMRGLCELLPECAPPIA